jgi:hypothetical protein
MEHQFDVVTRAFATCTSRRQALALLAAMTVVGSRAGRAAAAQADASACEAGLTYCPGAGACVDLLSDMNNCGACGEVCESQLVPVECRSGVCESMVAAISPQILNIAAPVRIPAPAASAAAAFAPRVEAVARARPNATVSASIPVAITSIAESAETSVRPVRHASRASAAVPVASAAQRARRSATAPASRRAATTTIAAPAAMSAPAV